MNDHTQPSFFVRFRRICYRLLSLGFSACGAIIIWTGIDLHAKLSGPYQANLKAFSTTINELDNTVTALRHDTVTFNTYLDTIRLQLRQTNESVESLDKETQRLLVLSGTNIPKMLDDTSKMVAEASKAIRDGSNRIGRIPSDPFPETRSSLYTISGTLTGVANTMKPVATEVRTSSREVASATENGMKSMRVILTASETSLGTLQTGAMEQLPGTMEALSGQLQSHLHLIESSYDFVSIITLPLLALGSGFFLIGLRGLIWVPNA